MKLALIVEYDGTRYHGFQWQANAPTIQGELEKALGKITGEKIRVIAASRTDAGGHAKGQVVSFRAESSLSATTWAKALNFYLPPDIAVKAAYKVSDDFNVRREALSREYHYYILNNPTRSPLRQGFAYLVPQLLDVEAMNRACQVLVGEHDFVPFIPVGSKVDNTLRKVYKAEISKREDLVIFEMAANSFLPHQVRNTVGGLIRVGLGKEKVETFWELAGSGKAGVVGPTAPAQGLCLAQVSYLNFPPEEGNEDL